MGKALDFFLAVSASLAVVLLLASFFREEKHCFFPEGISCSSRPVVEGTTATVSFSFSEEINVTSYANITGCDKAWLASADNRAPPVRLERGEHILVFGCDKELAGNELDIAFRYVPGGQRTIREIRGRVVR